MLQIDLLFINSLTKPLSSFLRVVTFQTLFNIKLVHLILFKIEDQELWFEFVTHFIQMLRDQLVIPFTTNDLQLHNVSLVKVSQDYVH